MEELLRLPGTGLLSQVSAADPSNLKEVVVDQMGKAKSALSDLHGVLSAPVTPTLLNLNDQTESLNTALHQGVANALNPVFAAQSKIVNKLAQGAAQAITEAHAAAAPLGVTRDVLPTVADRLINQDYTSTIKQVTDTLAGTTTAVAADPFTVVPPPPPEPAAAVPELAPEPAVTKDVTPAPCGPSGWTTISSAGNNRLNDPAVPTSSACPGLNAAAELAAAAAAAPPGSQVIGWTCPTTADGCIGILYGPGTTTTTTTTTTTNENCGGDTSVAGCGAGGSNPGGNTTIPNMPLPNSTTIVENVGSLAKASTAADALNALVKFARSFNVTIPDAFVPAVLNVAQGMNAGVLPAEATAGIDVPPLTCAAPPPGCPAPPACPAPPVPDPTPPSSSFCNSPNFCDPTSIHTWGTGPGAPVIGNLGDDVLSGLLGTLFGTVSGPFNVVYQASQYALSQIGIAAGAPIDAGIAYCDLGLGLAEKYIGVDLSPARRTLQYWQNALHPTLIPNSGNALQMYLGGSIDYDQYLALTSANGLCPQWAAREVGSSRSKPNPGELLYLWRTGVIDKNTRDQLLTQRGFTDDTERQQWIDSQCPTPGVGAVYAMAMSGTFNTDLVTRWSMGNDFDRAYNGRFKDYLTANGIGYGQGYDYWLSNSRLPSLNQVLQCSWRLRPDKPGVQNVTDDYDVTIALAASGLPRYWQDRIHEISRKVLPRYALQQGYNTNVTTDQELLSSYRDLGYSLEDSKTLLQAAANRKQQFISSKVGVGSDGFYGENYIQGLIDDTTMIGIVNTWTTAQPVVDQIMQELQTRRNYWFLKQGVAAIKKAYVRGLYTNTEAIIALQNIGVPMASQDRYLSLWQSIKSGSQKHLSAAQLCKYRGEGLMTPAEQFAGLTNLGYTPEMAKFIVEDCVIGLNKQDQAAMAKAEKAAAAQAKQKAKDQAAAIKLAKCGPPKVKC